MLNIFTYQNAFIYIFILVLLQIFAYRRQAIWVTHDAGLEQYVMISELPIICVISVFLFIGVFSTLFYVKLLAILFYFLLNFLLSITLVAIQKFGINLNIVSIKLGYINRKTLVNNEYSLVDFIKSRITFDFFLSQIIYILAYIFIIYNNKFSLYFYTLSIVYSVFVAFKVRISRVYNFILLVLSPLVICFSAATKASFAYSTSTADVVVILATCLLITVAFKWLGCYFNSPLFATKCTVSQFFAKCPLRKSKNFALNDESAEIIQPKATAFKRSPYYGVCKNANVILVTLESVSDVYTCKHNAKYSRLNYFDSLKAKSWLSNYHICISPNTNSSFFSIYTGQYFNSTPTNSLVLLKQMGYQTAYMSPELSDPLLKNLNFDQLLDYSCLDGGIKQSDAESFNILVEQLKTNYDPCKKLFLHIKNQQTHMPYSVFRSAAAADPFDRYQQSVIEADQDVSVLISHLAEFIDIDNTIIVYTADHGQSFGEMNYFNHSTSIINPQLQVPFLIYHPKLQPRNINFSSHFDLIPTVFDLLGVEIKQHRLGSSLGFSNVPFSHVVYSEHRCGNMPACFGHVNKERKILVDLIKNRTLLLDHQDKVLSQLKSVDLKYYQQLLLRALQARGLVNRSLFSDRWLK